MLLAVLVDLADLVVVLISVVAHSVVAIQVAECSKTSNPQQTSSAFQFIIKQSILYDFCYNFEKILLIPPTIPLPHNAT